MELHITNLASRGLHGPGSLFHILGDPPDFLARNGWIPMFRPWGPELGMMRTLIDHRKARMRPPADIAEAYEASMQRRFSEAYARGSLAPGQLRAAWPGRNGKPGYDRPLGSGSTLICMCSRTHADAGECHRVWVALWTAFAGWTVRLDGELLDPGALTVVRSPDGAPVRLSLPPLVRPETGDSPPPPAYQERLFPLPNRRPS